MSDLYTITLDDRIDGALDAILDDAASHGMQREATRAALTRHGGEDTFSAYTAHVRATHRDAWPLDRMSPGLMLFLLADCSEALTASLGGMDAINAPTHQPSADTSPLAYYILEQTKKPQALKVRVWCRTAHAPDPARSYSSTAWGTDADKALGGHGAPMWHSRLPAPGDAGRLRFHKNIYPLQAVGHMHIADAALVDGTIYLLGAKNGPVVRLDAPFEAATTLRHDPKSKGNYATLLAHEAHLWLRDKAGATRCIQRADGQPVEDAQPPADLEGLRGQRLSMSAAPGELRVEVTSAGELCARDGAGEERWRAQTGIKHVRGLSLCPDGETYILVTKSSLELWHQPTASRALSLYAHAIEQLVWSEDGRHLLGMSGAMLSIWRLT